MPYAVVAEKFTQKNGLDEAIAEVERGEVEVFNSFDAFKAAMS